MAPRILAVLLLVVVAGCGSSTTGPSGTSFVTANVDGVPWTASAASVAVGAGNPAAGAYTITMTQPGTNTSIITLSLNNIAKQTTYFLGVGITNFGGRGQYSDLTSGWVTANTGDDGSIQITTLTSTRIAGMFSFDAVALTGAATGTKHITSGQFDLPILAGAAGAGDTLGKSLSATIDNQFWNGSTVDGALTTGIFIATATGGMNSIGNVQITLNSVCAIGDYALSASGTTRTMSMSDLTGTKVWSSSGTGGGGKVTISNITSTLITGSFDNVTVVPVFGGATGTHTLTGGKFTLGQQTPPSCATTAQ